MESIVDSYPSPRLIYTFVVAGALKLVGAVAAMASGYILIQDWALDRWWGSFLTGIILLLLLLTPWSHPFMKNKKMAAHLQLIAALTFGILSPFIDLLHHTWLPQLTDSQIFVEQLNWSVEQVNNVPALGVLFIMVPVVLASWQYGMQGFFSSLAFSGFLYVGTPFLMPRNAFTWYLYGVRGFVLLGVTLILAFIVSTLATAQRREHAAVAEANHQLSVANRRLAQQTAVMEQLATSRERNRLARELHDTLAHSLSGTAVQLQAVGTLLNADPEAAKSELKIAQQQIKQGLQESRRAIAALRATPLETLGLIEAVRQRGDSFAQRTAIVLTCNLDKTLMQTLPLLTEQTIYRIVDEALVNIEKHAQASQASLSLWQQPDGLLLEITDDGVGFHVEMNDRNGRFGLIGMQERANLIGATLEIESQLGNGSCIKLQIPEPEA